MNQHAQRHLEQLLLVLDYDGTVTVDECNEIILQRFTGDAWRLLEAKALDGSLSHAECFKQQFGLVRAPRDELFAAMADLAEPAPGLAGFLDWALAGGARVAVVSVGFREVDRARLAARTVCRAVELYASELEALPEGGYTVVLDDLFGDCPSCGPGGCKGAAVRALRRVGDAVAVFGDGVADLCLAREADVVFARGVLGRLCAAEGIAYHPLTDFESARTLLERWVDDGRRDDGRSARERSRRDVSGQAATREGLRADALQFLKFALVGLSGVVVNVAVFSATLLVWLALTGHIHSGADLSRLD